MFEVIKRYVVKMSHDVLIKTSYNQPFSSDEQSFYAYKQSTYRKACFQIYVFALQFLSYTSSSLRESQSEMMNMELRGNVYDGIILQVSQLCSFPGLKSQQLFLCTSS